MAKRNREVKLKRAERLPLDFVTDEMVTYPSEELNQKKEGKEGKKKMKARFILFLLISALLLTGCHRIVPKEVCIKDCVIDHLDVYSRVDSQQISPYLYKETINFCRSIYAQTFCECNFDRTGCHPVTNLRD